MGNRRTREAQERKYGKLFAREVARLLHEDVGWRGAGERILQVVHAPSFDPGFAWEIRKVEDEFAVYRSSVEDVWGLGFLARGYSQLAVSSDELESYWEEVGEVAVDLSPLADSIWGFDDDSLQLGLFAGFTSVRFKWWSEYPPSWEPLDGIAREMIDAFRKAPEIGT